jgi:HSP20 family protein
MEMTTDISKWNPFRFLRKGSEERRAESSAQAQPGGHAGATLPSAWPDLSRLAWTDPFRLMNDLLRDPFGTEQTARWFGDFSPGLFQPRIDVVDDGDALRITAELPGVARDDIEVLVEEGFLILRGEKKLESKSEEKGCYRLERAFGSFQRAIPIPDGVDVEKAQARFDQGVLTLRLPKRPSGQASGKKLEIK